MADTAEKNKDSKSDTPPETPKVAAPGTNRLDLENKDVKIMLTKAKKSGLLTTAELNQHIDLQGITTDDIEVTLAQLSEMGISVIDEKEEETIGSKTLARTTTTAVKGGNSKEGLFPARAKFRSRNVLKQAATP